MCSTFWASRRKSRPRFWRVETGAVGTGSVIQWYYFFFLDFRFLFFGLSCFCGLWILEVGFFSLGFLLVGIWIIGLGIIYGF